MKNLNVGTVANDKTGQTLRSSMLDIQSNIDELNGKIPTKIISTAPPSGIPANGDEWITYSAT